MTIKTLYHFTVVGKMGHFPIDMLRYDRCYPATSADATLINRLVPHEKKMRRKPTRVDLTGHCEPTVQRWESFLWRVDLDSIKAVKI